MGETLFIAHRIPFPPDRGDKIRSHNLLRALAALGPVHVATLAETDADRAAESALVAMCQSHCLATRPLGLARPGIRALSSGKPVSLTAFSVGELHEWIARLIAERPIDTIFVFSGQMGQYVPASFEGRVVIDLCDVDSAKFEAYAQETRGPRSWLFAREARLLAIEEARLAARAHTTLLVSEAEADLLRSRQFSNGEDIRALGNGIDTRTFDPQTIDPHPALLAEPGPHIVFTGQMDYPPNVAAVKWAATAIMPGLRERFPTARFHVVGRAPTAEVLALEDRNGTRVWGEVPDVRPFLAVADLVLAPLAIARGVQNKVLEAMAMARPVVLSPEAATGIEGIDGVHFAIGADDASLTTAALELLSDGARAMNMGAAARRFVIADKGWDAALAPLAAIMGRAEKTRDAA